MEGRNSGRNEAVTGAEIGTRGEWENAAVASEHTHTESENTHLKCQNIFYLMQRADIIVFVTHSACGSRCN